MDSGGFFILLRREGWNDNHQRVYRIYKEEGLNLRTKRPRRRKSAAHRMEWPEILTINQCWGMDFTSDQLFDGSRCMAIHPEKSIKGENVVELLNEIKHQKKEVPERIQLDNGTEFISKALDLWAYENNVTLDYSRLGKPTDNPYIEPFNGRLRDECLIVNWFFIFTRR